MTLAAEVYDQIIRMRICLRINKVNRQGWVSVGYKLDLGQDLTELRLGLYSEPTSPKPE